MSIIVTTNAKKDMVNHQKLEELLPNQREYICYSTDRVVNLPVQGCLPDRLNDNAGKTGNLQNILRLKIGAPVVITTNNAKRKYREDGLCNGLYSSHSSF